MTTVPTLKEVQEFWLQIFTEGCPYKKEEFSTLLGLFSPEVNDLLVATYPILKEHREGLSLLLQITGEANDCFNFRPDRWRNMLQEVETARILEGTIFKLYESLKAFRKETDKWIIVCANLEGCVPFWDTLGQNLPKCFQAAFEILKEHDPEKYYHPIYKLMKHHDLAGKIATIVKELRRCEQAKK